MHISKVSIQGEEIPIKKGILRKIDFGTHTSIEAELIVHPTVVNFINTLGFIKEQVTILSKQNVQVIGDFEIHTRQSSMLLVGKPNEVKGIDQLASVPYEKSSFPLDSGEGMALDDELYVKQKTVLVNILESLLENAVHDEENHLFLHSLLEKLKKDEKLTAFDQYIKSEVSYLIGKALAN